MKLVLVDAGDALTYQMKVQGKDTTSVGVKSSIDQYRSEQSIAAYQVVSENSVESKDNPTYLIFTVTLPKRLDMSFYLLSKKLTISLINYDDEMTITAT